MAPPFQMEFNLRLVESYERRLQGSPEEFLTRPDMRTSGHTAVRAKARR